MKKTLSILLIAILAVSSIIGVSAAVSMSTATADTASPLENGETYEVMKMAETTAAQTSSEELIIPDITGVWKHENNPQGHSITVNWQDGNTINFTVTSTRNNGAQIATSDITVTLDTYDDDAIVRGTADFDYVDSFGNSGTGSVSVSENVFLLVIDQGSEMNCWGIANATGEYLFCGDTSNSEQTSDEQVIMPQLRTVWINESNPQGCSIVVNWQDGNTINFTVTSMRNNGAQIATSDITVTLDTFVDGTIVRGMADFDYVDSFGNSGTGSVSVSENVFLLVIDQGSEMNCWGIANATGKYL